MSIRLTPELVDEIQAHAARHYPNEGAGVILGVIHSCGDSEGRQLLCFDNAFRTEERYHRYQIDPLDMLAAENQAEELNLAIIAVFHSHPDHPARPSEFDRSMAFPWFSYLITSVHQGKVHQTRSWKLDEEQQFKEEPITIYKAVETS